MQALGLRGSDDDARNLLATLDARQIDPWQLEATGEALAALGRMETRHILIERLDDRVAERQRAAARALGLYPTADTLTAYRALLNQADTGSPVLQAVILAVSRWQDAQPGLLRQACAEAGPHSGCAACRGTGYRGRLPVVEVLRPSPALREALLAGAGVGELRERARDTGWEDLATQAEALLASGRTSAAELGRCLGLRVPGADAARRRSG